jgi:hypothetical protein
MAADDAKERDEEDEKRDEENLRARLQGVIPDVVKRTFAAGLGAVFASEEGIRKMVSDFHLPKDVGNFIVTQAQGTKDELFRIVAEELRKWLDRVDVQRELTRLMTMVSVEVKTEIRFIPNDQALVKPDIKRKVSIKRAKREEPTEPPPATEPPKQNGE